MIQSDIINPGLFSESPKTLTNKETNLFSGCGCIYC